MRHLVRTVRSDRSVNVHVGNELSHFAAVTQFVIPLRRRGGRLHVYVLKEHVLAMDIDKVDALQHKLLRRKVGTVGEVHGHLVDGHSCHETAHTHNLRDRLVPNLELVFGAEHGEIAKIIVLKIGHRRVDSGHGRDSRRVERTRIVRNTDRGISARVKRRSGPVIHVEVIPSIDNLTVLEQEDTPLIHDTLPERAGGAGRLGGSLAIDGERDRLLLRRTQVKFASLLVAGSRSNHQEKAGETENERFELHIKTIYNSTL